MESGTIFDLQRFCLHDGPGIRTTVFLKGCPLRCRWCHNPESQSPDPELSFAPGLCVGCGACARVCPSGAATRGEDGRARIDRARCVRCFRCVAVCPSRALERAGRVVTVAEVIEAVEADRPFYETSGGGLTLSGGEPLRQPRFGHALLEAARRRGLHACVETSGAAAWDVLAAWRPYVDRWLFDVKETDPERHRRFTGLDWAPILDNLRRLDRAGASLELRVPLVPGANLRESHLEAVAGLARELKGCVGVTPIRYHPLGRGKRERFSLSVPFDPDETADASEASEEVFARACDRLRALGASPPPS